MVNDSGEGPSRATATFVAHQSSGDMLRGTLAVDALEKAAALLLSCSTFQAVRADDRGVLSSSRASSERLAN
jgi:hypothetical protein